MKLPYIDQGGHRRILAALPTPSNHQYTIKPHTWAQGVAAGDLPDIKISDILPFKNIRHDVPILDQGSQAACLPHAWVTAFMIARAVSGAPPLPLSPWFLYTLINHDEDSGSNAGEAYNALMNIGVCPDNLVPHGTIRPYGYSDQAKDCASRFRLRKAFRIHGFEQAVIAASLGYGITFDIHVGDNLTVNSDGVARYEKGETNHEVFAGEGYVIINGKPYLDGRNSWGTTWGVHGRCYWQESHLNDSQETYALEAVYDDPQDTEMPAPCNVGS